MPQRDVLRNAARDMVRKFIRAVDEFSLDEFLKSGVDPFRFSFNIAILGIEKATEKEIEHKLAMKLENMVGEFHENYLGNVEHKPTTSKWEKVPQGTIPGVDIRNRTLKAFFQLKSKHNSMNSSSSKKLGDELKALNKQNPDATVGCGWVIASEKRGCIGESYIDGKKLKGRKLFAYITGEENELDELIAAFPEMIREVFPEIIKEKSPEMIREEAKDIDYNELLNKASTRIYQALEAKAKQYDMDIITFLYNNAVGDV